MICCRPMFCLPTQSGRNVSLVCYDNHFFREQFAKSLFCVVCVVGLSKMRMRNRTTLPDNKPDVGDGITPSGNKRHYNRKTVMCRLCLRLLPKEDLPEIFAPSGCTHKAIQAAVSIQVQKKDRSIRICHCCLDIIYLINDFRKICERTELLISQNVDISAEAFWSDEADRKLFEKCRTLVEQCQTEVDRLFIAQSLVYCEVQKEDLIDESVDPPEPSELVIEHSSPAFKQEKDEDDDIKAEDESDNGNTSVKTEDDIEADFSDTGSQNLDCEEKKEPEGAIIEDEKKSEWETKINRKSKEPKDRPRRRGRPALPEEMLKRRRRKPGEPKQKPGPKNRAKLPTQSVCEICGMLVNRENEERHRNEHLGHRPYACTVEGCTHSFSSKAGLHGHLARHADRNNVYDCDICGAKIKTKSSLHRHRKMHTTEKPHACNICGKRFWRKSYLNHHATVHTGIAKFPCEYCGFVFKNKYWRSFHIKQKHVAKGEMPKFETQDEIEELGEIPEEAVPVMNEEYA
ncbi:zinc finger and SCAN domain-containing protein 12-like [Toxorhynchites rutilus septentrionalis]|uniref:zinc finger and SCAN domain-containing protein 12-like n=1 Tax=Toxorhynchites rutilus septentrionalis TaxID=329112 RepID=UPI0024798BB6|nr:zinc finger and SCAN domain-containing protein 12-like [Toxorhynchites rutilus septentrionalis]